MATTAERLWLAAQSLPEPLLAQVLDFAEFLQARRVHAQHEGRNVKLLELCGGLEDSANFSGSAQVIQERLRDEWR